VLEHNAIPHDGGWLDKKLTKYALKDARNFVAMTEKETERLSAVVHKTSKIETSAHPVYAQFPLSGLSKAKVREKLGLPNGCPIALFFGFVRPYKGLGILLEAVGILKQEKVNVHLLVAGEFWQGEADYMKQINDLNICDMVTIRADYIPDLEAGLYFEAADIFVAPYLEGTQSGSIKLAMGYGLPLVVTDVIVDQTILEYPIGCQVVPTGNVIALATAMRNFLTGHDTTNDIEVYISDSWNKLISTITIGHNAKVN
jgi:glycosyltransferase involved in cell wall biosynthesis